MPKIKERATTIKKTTWQEVKQQIALINPEFAQLVNELDPGNDFTLYQLSYPYGSLVLDKGCFLLPNNKGELVPLSDSNVDKSLQQDFSYAHTSMPFGILTNHSAELLIECNQEYLPWQIFKPGDFISVATHIGRDISTCPFRIFSMTAGARYIFMLANIGNSGLHQNLVRDLNIRLTPPKSLLEHWRIFTQISNHPVTECDWTTDILLFGEKWINKLRSDKAWQSLHYYLLNKVWQRSEYWRRQAYYEFAFSCAQAKRNLRPNPYLADTAKHLLAIIVGAAPGFTAADNEDLAPIKLLQNIFVENYGLKQHAPIIMHSDYFTGTSPLYYSLQLPTTLEFSPKSRKLSSTLSELGELKYIMDVFTQEIVSGNLGVEDTKVGMALKNSQLQYFHNKKDPHGEITLSSHMPEKDANLLKHYVKNNNQKNNKFPEAATFLRGCLGIYNKTT